MPFPKPADLNADFMPPSKNLLLPQRLLIHLFQNFLVNFFTYPGHGLDDMGAPLFNIPCKLCNALGIGGGYPDIDAEKMIGKAAVHMGKGQKWHDLIRIKAVFGNPGGSGGIDNGGNIFGFNRHGKPLKKRGGRILFVFAGPARKLS